MIFKDYDGFGAAPAKKPSLAPALLGAGGGFVVAGPVGAAVGGAIGYALGKSQAKKAEADAVTQGILERKAKLDAEKEKLRKEALARLHPEGAGGAGTAHSFVQKIPVIGGLLDMGIKALVGHPPTAAQYIAWWNARSPLEKSAWKSFIVADAFVPGMKAPEFDRTINKVGDMASAIPPIGRTLGQTVRTGDIQTDDGYKLIDVYQALPDWGSTPMAGGGVWTFTELTNDPNIVIPDIVKQAYIIGGVSAVLSLPIDNVSRYLRWPEQHIQQFIGPQQPTQWTSPYSPAQLVDLATPADTSGGGARQVNGFGRYGDLSVRALRIAQSRSRGKY